MAQNKNWYYEAPAVKYAGASKPAVKLCSEMTRPQDDRGAFRLPTGLVLTHQTSNF